MMETSPTRLPTRLDGSQVGAEAMPDSEDEYGLTTKTMLYHWIDAARVGRWAILAGSRKILVMAKMMKRISEVGPGAALFSG